MSGPVSKYPCVGGDVKVENMLPEFQNRDCECCKKKTPATHCVYVQVSWMRGEDDCYMVCDYHVGLARRPHLFKKFLEHYESAKREG